MFELVGNQRACCAIGEADEVEQHVSADLTGFDAVRREFGIDGLQNGARIIGALADQNEVRIFEMMEIRFARDFGNVVQPNDIEQFERLRVRYRPCAPDGFI